MSDPENNPVDQEAPDAEGTQWTQESGSETPDYSPETPADKEERLYAGKFKSAEELEQSYKELESKFTRERQASRASGEQELSGGFADTPPSYDPPGSMENATSAFDEPTQTALQTWYKSQREAEKAADFVRKHREDLQDPLIDGAVRRLMAEARQKQIYLDQEEALSQAKKLVEDRLKPKVEEASSQAFAEGAELSRKKELSGAIGESGKREQVDPNKLSASEFARLHGLKYENE